MALFHKGKHYKRLESYQTLWFHWKTEAASAIVRLWKCSKHCLIRRAHWWLIDSVFFFNPDHGKHRTLHDLWKNRGFTDEWQPCIIINLIICVCIFEIALCEIFFLSQSFAHNFTQVLIYLFLFKPLDAEYVLAISGQIAANKMRPNHVLWQGFKPLEFPMVVIYLLYWDI